MSKLKVVSYNLRCNVRGDGINMFDIRKGLILDKIESEKPDVIGFQEETPPMRRFLESHLNGYTLVGRSRSEDRGGEYVDIAFRNETISIDALDYFWLSPTPYVPGSRYEVQSSCPRITTAATLFHKPTGKTFRMYNTHLDHVGAPARELGLGQIIDRIIADSEREPFPFFLTGDFNDTPDSSPLMMLRKGGRLPLTELSESAEVTYHGWGKTAAKIDYVFADNETGKAPCTCCIWDDCVNGVYLSDHYPVCCEIEF
ncbi:MAG: endonuclease/exonuclease/phosphatase family protein [Clostridiales bacterium]|nr:endonuclease/exonuclease/phosphatase family protein [Clostridiales bacterium]